MNLLDDQNKQNVEVPLSLVDFWLIFKRAKRKIIYGSLFFASAAFLYSVTKPIEYQAAATFREKGRSQSGVNLGLSALLLSGSSSGGHSEAISIMKSRTLLERLVTKIGLQATIIKNEASYSTLAAIRDNLKIEIALFNKKQGPLLIDKPLPITAQNVVYTGDVPLVVRIKFLNQDSFQVFTPDEESIAFGQLGSLFSTKKAGFSLIRTSLEPLEGKEYIIILEPLNDVTKRLSGKFLIETDREDKGLLHLKYTSSYPRDAADTVNILMFVYQEHLKDEQERVLNEQMDYLQTRQNEIGGKFQKMMEDHAGILSKDAASTGCLEVKQTIEFFIATQQQYTRDLFALELELKRLEQVKQDGSSYYERYVSENGNSITNMIVSQIRELKQRADSLELAQQETQETRPGGFESPDQVALQFVDLDEVHQLKLESIEMLADMKKGIMPNPSLSLYNDPRYMVKKWCEMVMEKSNQKKESCKTSFISYLSHLIHIFHVREQAIHERLTHQHQAQEFQGINLNTTEELYLTYSKELSAVEAEKRQKNFIIEEMQEPSFEISSLCTILPDNISQKMIVEASDLLLSLRDQNNRSLREQERLKSELMIQKGFLAVHLQQAVQLLQLREKMLKEKLKALQITSLGLIQQEISVLQKHLMDNIKTRISNLFQEKELIKQHQQALQEKMAALPAKWVAEKMIDHQTDLNKKMVEEISKLFESKSIASNLELIQSAPIDLALVPIQPKAPRLAIFTLLGALLGAFFTSGFVLAKAIKKGLPVTAANVELAKQHISGRLSKLYKGHISQPLTDQDLETLRHADAFLNSSAKKQTSALLLIDNGPDYSEDLALLMAKKGFKVLIMYLSFDRVATSEEQPGLLQYLECGTFPEIKHMKDHDAIYAGGVTRFAHELLGKEHFKELIIQLKEQYDCLLAISRAPLSSSEAEYLLGLFDSGILTIHDQCWKDLNKVINKNLNALSPSALSFIFLGENI